jgi:hypothetical protein
MSEGISEVAEGDAPTLFDEFKHILKQLTLAFDKKVQMQMKIQR